MFVVYVIPFFGLFALVVLLLAAFRLNRLQLRIWRASRRLRSSPEWELLQGSAPPGGGLSAEAEPAKRRPVLGCVLLVLGAVLFLGSAAITVAAFCWIVDTPPPVLLPLAAVILMFIGAEWSIGTRKVICPHCGLAVKQAGTVCCFICPKCGKGSIRQGDFFTSEEYLRNLPQFQDLPKL